MQIIEILEQTKWGEMLITFCVAMMPVLELRGAIPLGVSMGLQHWTAMAVAVAGNIIPAPFIIVFIRKIFLWLRNKSDRLRRLIERMESRAAVKQGIVYKYRIVGLVLLVAIPLPGTGAWTGALIAALMDIRMRNALPAIFIGVLVAGFLITGLTFGFTAIFT